jgi:hypothetical protein
VLSALIAVSARTGNASWSLEANSYAPANMTASNTIASIAMYDTKPADGAPNPPLVYNDYAAARYNWTDEFGVARPTGFPVKHKYSVANTLTATLGVGAQPYGRATARLEANGHVWIEEKQYYTLEEGIVPITTGPGTNLEEEDVFSVERDPYNGVYFADVMFYSQMEATSSVFNYGQYRFGQNPPYYNRCPGTAKTENVSLTTSNFEIP